MYHLFQSASKFDKTKISLKIPNLSMMSQVHRRSK